MRTWRRLRAAAPLVALVVFLGGCAADAPQDTFDADGRFARDINNLISPVFIVAGVVFLLVLGGAVFIGIKFRATGDDEDAEMPNQIHGNDALEIGWTVLPAVVLLVIGVFSVAAIYNLNQDAPEDAVKVQVVGHQWWWEYRYDMDGNGRYDDPEDFVTANDLVIPAGEFVDLDITSRDVVHSFWVPKLNGKRDAAPNRHHPWLLETDGPGEWVGQCAEFCGLSHAEMRIKVIALERGDFDAWVDNQQSDAATFAEDDTSMAAEGYRVFNGQLCAQCHLVEGVNDELFSDEDIAEELRDVLGGPGTIPDPDLQVNRHAPNLTHLMSRTTFAGAKFDLRRDTDECVALGVDWADDPDDLERCLDRGALEAWLRDPPAEKAMYAHEVPSDNARGMPNLQLSEEQIDQLVAYLTTLK